MQQSQFANAGSRASRELRAVERALNFTQGKRHRSWRDYLEWLDVSVESAMRHAVMP